MAEDTETKRKRLIFRSWHRGTREIDLMMGGFADAHLPNLNDTQLDAYDRFLANSDPDIYNWMTEKEPLPPAEDNDVVQLILQHLKKVS